VVYVIFDYGWLPLKGMVIGTWEIPPEFIAVPLLVGIPLLAGVGLLFSAARRLTRFEDYGFVTVASILAMLPWSAAFLIGLPVGLWTLLFLRRPDVRLAFLQAGEGGRNLDSDAISRGPVRRGLGSFFGGMGSLFLGSRATAAYDRPRSDSPGVGQFPSLSASMPQPSLNPGDPLSPKELSSGVSPASNSQGSASQSKEGSGANWAFAAPWIFGIVLVLAFAALKIFGRIP
jgi:hypothetical protein